MMSSDDESSDDESSDDESSDEVSRVNILNESTDIWKRAKEQAKSLKEKREQMPDSAQVEQQAQLLLTQKMQQILNQNRKETK